MATNGDMPSDEESGPESPEVQATDGHAEVEEEPLDQPRSVLKKSEPLPEIKRPELPEQPNPQDLDVSKLTPLSPEIIARQATINIGTIGHVAHGKSTVVKAISGVQTVRFKNELERNITIKLGYANAKIYKCDNEECPRPTCYKSYKSEKEVDPPCERAGCKGRYRLVRHVSYVYSPSQERKNMLIFSQLRRLPRSRYSHEHHVVRRRRHGRRPPSDRRKRNLPSTANIRASCSYRNHEARPYHHSSEQSRSDAYRGSRATLPVDRKLCPRNRRRQITYHSYLRTAEVQHRCHQ